MGLEPTTSAVTGRRSNQLSHQASQIEGAQTKFGKSLFAPSTRFRETKLLSRASPHNSRFFLSVGKLIQTSYLTFRKSRLSPRPISIGQLRTLLHFHLRPIYLIVSKGSYSYDGKSHLEGGFTLRCLQRLSRPDLATRLCTWQYNRYTSGPSIPVLSY